MTRYRAFQAQPLGSIQLAGREIAIRGRRLRGERLRDAVTRAYAGKYDTKASEKWVRGFAAPRRKRGNAVAARGRRIFRQSVATDIQIITCGLGLF